MAIPATRWSLAILLLGGCVEGDDIGGPAPSEPSGEIVVDGDDDALPEHFRTTAVAGLDNTPADNPTTVAGANLGRHLFFDERLSQNRTISCASCHRQSIAFTDEKTLSEGFEGGATGRNSMSLVNVRWYDSGRFFWDERAETLEEQVLMPIQDSVEMGMTLTELEERVRQADTYPELFVAAFGDSDVTSERISLALAQFVRSMISYRSPYDVGFATVRNPIDDFPNFSRQENLGKRLFFESGCAGCHLGPPPGPGANFDTVNNAIFFVDEAVNNGLDATTVDLGLAGVTGLATDEGKFKSPSLRNVEFSAPYMHDGRFATLAEVVDFYSDDVNNHTNLDRRLRDPRGNPRRLALTEADKAALVAFLRTLSDESFLADPAFADPFEAN